MIRNLVALFSLLFGLSLAVITAAENSQEKTKEYVEEAAKILAIFDVWAKASTECNSKTLNDIYHPKISFWPSVAKEPFYGVEDTVKVFEKMCELNPFLRVTPINRYVDLQGDTAVVFGALEFRRMLNDQLTEVPVRYSFTLIKEESDWKILHMQSATIPFSPAAQATDTDSSQ